METTTEKLLAHFEGSGGSGSSPWEVVNDGVMGGVSRSQWIETNGLARFSGVVSLENNGGFASVRTRPDRMDCSGYDGFLIRLRGDGKRYKFTVRTHDRFDGTVYQKGFETKQNQWQEIRLPFRSFQPTYHGRALAGEPPLSAASISSVGVLISDKQAGVFSLEVAWIKAVRERGGP